MDLFKTALALFSLISFSHANAYVADRFEGGVHAAKSAIVLFNQNGDPRCKMDYRHSEDQARVQFAELLKDSSQLDGELLERLESLRECDAQDTIYAKIVTADSMQSAGLGGWAMGLTLFVMTVGNAAITCGMAINRDENNVREKSEGPFGAALRGGVAGIIQTGLGILFRGVKLLPSTALWSFGVLVPTNLIAHSVCNKGLDSLIDFAEEHGEEVEQEPADQAADNAAETAAPVEDSNATGTPAPATQPEPELVVDPLDPVDEGAEEEAPEVENATEVPAPVETPVVEDVAEVPTPAEIPAVEEVVENPVPAEVPVVEDVAEEAPELESDPAPLPGPETVLSMPSALFMQNPASSTGTELRPTIRVEGVAVGDVVYLYSNANCDDSGLLASGVAQGAVVDIQLDIPLAPGEHTIYANRVGDQGVGASSDCSAASVTYTLQAGSGPAAPSALSMQNPAANSGVNAAPTVRVEGVEPGNVVLLFRDSRCGGMEDAVGFGIAGGTTADVFVFPPLGVGTHTLHARRMNAQGEPSACSTASVNYEVVSDPAQTPAVPLGLSMQNPAASAGANATPTVRVDGVGAGHGAALYVDSQCTLFVGLGLSVGTAADIAIQAPLAAGQYTFYARSLRPLGQNGPQDGVVASACSSASVAYEVLDGAAGGDFLGQEAEEEVEVVAAPVL